MAKNVIFCADGTWNGTGGAYEIADANPTNVLKLFRNLAGYSGQVPDAAEMEITAPAERGAPEQRAKYLHGVGDTSNMLAQMAEGALGLGLICRVLRGYTYLSRNYAAGDAIFITGFSRGAYTARALGGLISAMGLLDWKGLGLNPGGSDDNGYKYAASAWVAYQVKMAGSSGQNSPLGRIEDAFADAPDFLSWLAYRPKYIADVGIKTIGVWETVGALGIPEVNQADTERLDLLRFCNITLSDKVANGFHAIAADEQRVDFSPTLWDSRAGVTQVFFAGAHSDVGGGYPLGDESLLSGIALGWMQRQLRGTGMRIAGMPNIGAGDALGPMHAPWLEAQFFKRPTSPRIFPAKSGSGITCDAALNARLGQVVVTVNPNSAAQNVAGPYVPVALIQAGYINATLAAA